jgi:hypothetical protein
MVRGECLFLGGSIVDGLGGVFDHVVGEAFAVEGRNGVGDWLGGESAIPLWGWARECGCYGETVGVPGQF